MEERLRNEIFRLADEIADHPENIEKLISIAKQSPENNKQVVKAAVHWECLGKEKNYENLSKLIFQLDDLEDTNPEIEWGQTVLSTLAATLSGDEGKKIDMPSPEEENGRNYRADISKSLILYIGFKKWEKTVSALLFGFLYYDSDKQQHNVKELMDLMLENDVSFEKTDEKNLRTLGINCATVLGDYVAREYAKKIIRKIIENEGPLIYFVGPLMNVLNDGLKRKHVEELLKDMGYLDREEQKRIERERKTEWIDSSGYRRRVRGCSIEAVKALVNELEEQHRHKFGKASDEVLREYAITFTKAKDEHVEYVKWAIKKIVYEDVNNLIYLAMPLAKLLHEEEYYEKYSKDCLDKILASSVYCNIDNEFLKELAKKCIFSYSDINTDETRFTKYDIKDETYMILDKIIYMGENELIYMAVPLVSCKVNSNRDIYYGTNISRLLEKIKESGAELGGDEEIFSELLDIARNTRDPTTREHTEWMIERIEKEEKARGGNAFRRAVNNTRKAKRDEGPNGRDFIRKRNGEPGNEIKNSRKRRY